MSEKFNVLKNEINEGFYEIVGIINEIIGHRTETFSEMIEISENVHEGSESFVKDTGDVIETISSNINDRIENLNMGKMKDDISNATRTFIEITEELELLSYNTICRTMALGEKGATITHISKEIKKYSTTVKGLLDVISGNFSEMFTKFKYVADHLMENQIKPDESSFELEETEDLVISSDVSVLIEYSQFHDIYMQELEIINDALSKTDFSDAYEAGLIFGILEKAMSKLEPIKYSLHDKLESIKSVMGDFIYSFNTDLQNIVSRTNILKMELNKINKASDEIRCTISSLKGSVHDTEGILNTTRYSIEMLAKQSKTFRNLVVITAVEVARINDDSLRSVVVSMNQTESELNGLIDQLHENIDMWAALKTDFVDVFAKAESELDKICDGSSCEDRERILESTEELDSQLDSFREMFMAEKYVRFFDTNTSNLMELFDQFNDYVQETFVDFNESLGDEILSDETFTNGRNNAELKEILAEQDEQSSIEFF